MKTDRPALLNLATLVVVTVQLAYAIHVWLNGPTDPIPMHFGLNGEPDRWGDRTEAALLIGGLGFLNLVVSGGMGLAASRTDDPARARSLRFGQLVSLIAMVGVTALIAAISVGGLDPANGLQFHMAGLGLLFAVIGGYMGKVGPNPFVGVRTPWTYKSRLAWDRSNRLAGRLMFWMGLLGLIGSAFAPQPLGLGLLVGAIILAAALSIFESWRVWRSDPERQPF